MRDLSRKYGKALKKLEGQELLDELQELIAAISKEGQRSIDRGCYLILENAPKLTASEQELIVGQMLEVNPLTYCSRGVKQNLELWKEQLQQKKVLELLEALKEKPQAEQEAAICNLLESIPEFNFQTGKTLGANWQPQAPLAPETQRTLLSKVNIIHLNMILPQGSSVIDLLFDACADTSYLEGLDITELARDFQLLLLRMKKEDKFQGALAVLRAYEFITSFADRFQEEEVAKFIFRLDDVLHYFEMDGFQNRLEMEFRSSLFQQEPQPPSVDDVDEQTARKEIREALRCFRGKQISVYSPLHKAVRATGLALGLQLEDLYASLYDMFHRSSETLDLAAYIAVAARNKTWQKQILKRLRDEKHWDFWKNHFDALMILLRTVQLDDEEFVIQAYSTRRPRHGRLI